MRKISALLLSVLLLTGCAAPEEKTIPPQAAKSVSVTDAGNEVSPADAEEPSTGAAVVHETGVTMACERAEYELTAKKIPFIVTNNSKAAITTETNYGLEKLEESGEWVSVPLRENTAWTAIGIVIESGKPHAFNCSLEMFDHDFSTGGTYRITKNMEGQVYTAEFSLVEKAPEEGGLVIENGIITENGGLAAQFLEKVSLDMDCRLQIHETGSDSTGETTEIIYEDGRFLYRSRSGDSIAERYFAYIITDGKDLYLSNAADWDTAMERVRYTAIETPSYCILPQGCAGAELVSMAEEMTDARLANNIIRYKVWSPDGAMAASLTTNPTEFAISSSGSGVVTDLQHYDGLETAIVDLAWQEDGSVLLTCTGIDGKLSTLRAALEQEPLGITVTSP